MITQKRIDTGEFTVLYKSNNKSNIVLVCPGIGYYKSGPYFLLSNIARELYKETNVMLFDYYGEGDSDGEYSDVSIDRIITSGRNVLEYIKKIGYDNIILVGLGIGNIVCLKLETDKEVDSIVHIDYLSSRFNNKNKSDLLLSDDIKKGLIGIFSEERNNVITDNFINNLSYDIGEQSLLNKEHYFVNQVKVNNTTYSLSEIDISNKMLPFIFDKIVEEVCNLVKEKADNWDKQLTCDYNNDIFESTEITREIEGLQGVLHSGNNEVCIIFEPGLGGDRIDHMRTGVLLGRNLLKQGFDVFRYDFIGCGISEGDFHKYSWEARINKLNKIIEKLKFKNGYKKIGIVSYSEGAKLASYITDMREDIIGTVMMSPALYNGFYNYSGVEEQNICKVFVPKFTNDKKRGICYPTQAFFLGMQYFTEQKKFDFYTNYRNIEKEVCIIYGENDSLFESALFNNDRSDNIKINGEGHLYTYGGTIEAINHIIKYFKNIVDDVDKL